MARVKIKTFFLLQRIEPNGKILSVGFPCDDIEKAIKKIKGHKNEFDRPWQVEQKTTVTKIVWSSGK